MKRWFNLFLVALWVLLLCACSKVELDAKEIEVRLGETAQVTASSENEPITYTSGNEKILKVNKDGLITPVDVGQTTVTATDSEGKTAVCTVTVSHLQPSEITITCNKEQMVAGETAKLICEFMPDNTTNKKVTWESSSPEIVTVDAYGTITCIKTGTASVTATSDCGVSGSFDVTISPLAESMTIDSEVTITDGDKWTLKPEFSPSGSYIENCTWTSSDENIVKVSWGNVFAISPGKATITVESELSHKTAQCEVILNSD